MQNQNHDKEVQALLITSIDAARRTGTLKKIQEAGRGAYFNAYDPFTAHKRNLSCFKAYSRESCQNINCSLNMLLTGIPRSMEVYKIFARALEPELYPCWHALPYEKSQTLSRNRADINRLDQISEITGSDCSHMIVRLAEISQDPFTFLSGFTNLRDFSLMWLVQKMLCSTPDFTGGFIENQSDAELRSMLAQKLHELNCSRNYTHNVTRLSYRKLARYFGPVSEDGKHPGHHAKYGFHEILGNSFQCMFVMCALGLYLMTQRSMICPEHTEKLFSLEHLPSRLSLPLAIGSYETVRMIPSFYGRTGIAGAYLEAVPGFEDYAAIVEYVLNGCAKVVGCSRCDTPYLIFSGELADPRHPELCRHCCPKCEKRAEYIYDDEEFPAAC